MKTTLVLLANASYAKMFSDQGNSHLDLVQEIEHPESRQKAMDLVSDRSGRYKCTGAYGGYEAHTSVKATEKDRFAIEVCQLIQKEMEMRNCHNWILIVDPSFYGFLKKHFSKSAEQRLERVIKKNPAGIEERSIKSIAWPLKSWAA